MFCSKCGKQIPDGSKFCPYCGEHSDFAEDANSKVASSKIIKETTQVAENQKINITAEKTKKKIPVTVIIVAIIILFVLRLVSCGKAVTPREYNVMDFMSEVPSMVTFCDTSNSLYRGNEIEDFPNAKGNSDYQRSVFKRNILNDFSTASQEKYNDSLIDFIETYFPQYVFDKDAKSRKCVALEYLGLHDEYAYFKVTVKIPGKLRERFSGWKDSDEVYMIVSGGLGNSESGAAAKFTYFITNFTEREAKGETVNSESTLTQTPTEKPIDSATEMTVSPQACVKDKTITTQYYSVTVPDTWISRYAYEKLPDENGIQFLIPGGYDGVNDSTLCTVEMVNAELLSNLDMYDYVGEIAGAESPYIIVKYPQDCQYTDATKIQYYMLAVKLPELVGSITGENGFTIDKGDENAQNSDTENAVDQDIPYVEEYADAESFGVLDFERGDGVLGMEDYYEDEPIDLSIYCIGKIPDGTRYFADEAYIDYIFALDDGSIIGYMRPTNLGSAVLAEQYIHTDVRPFIVEKSTDAGVEQTLIWQYVDAYVIMETYVNDSDDYMKNIISSFLIIDSNECTIVH